jgi:hypothetical protein
MRFTLCSLAVAISLAGTQSLAQDVLGPVNPADYTGAITMGSAINAKARKGANFRGTGFSERYVREQCAGLPVDRARYGPANRRVVRWTRICRSARLLR